MEAISVNAFLDIAKAAVVERFNEGGINLSVCH